MFFSSLEILDLRNTSANWELTTLNNVVELPLEGGQQGWEVTTGPHVATALASCLQLRSLKLGGLRFKSADTSYSFELGELRVLNQLDLVWNNDLEL
jgi:hypothetical protein